MKILVLGSSHIKRYEQFLRNSGGLDFDLYTRIDVSFLGISGGRIFDDGHVEHFKQKVISFAPDFIIMQIGGNDLDNCTTNQDMEVLIHRLLAVVSMLGQVAAGSVRGIFINQLLFRTHTRHTPVQIYNDRVIVANRTLKAELSSWSGSIPMVYWKVKGFANSTVQVLSDGVHFTDVGFQRYHRVIRGIILQCLRH